MRVGTIRALAMPTPSLAGRRLERNQNVLWTYALPGIVLHNLATARYLELGELGYQAWALLDGARFAEEVVARLTLRGTTEERAALAAEVWGIVATLAEHGFIVERHDG